MFGMYRTNKENSAQVSLLALKHEFAGVTDAEALDALISARYDLPKARTLLMAAQASGMPVGEWLAKHG